MKTRQALVILSLVAMLVGTGTVAVAAFSAAGSNTALFENLGDAIERQQDQRYGEDSVACVRNWSLYDGYYLQRNYDMAFEPWRYMFDHCPLATLNIYLPNAESAFLMGRLDNTRENYRSAITFFQQAADLYTEEGVAPNRDRIFRAYWLMAEISYRQFRELPQARGYARQAHQTIPDDGRPLILIGEMYAASASECGDDDVAKKAAYWVVVDKFIEARNVTGDEIVRERAQQMADTYRLYFPNNEEIFFHGYSEGETYRVECWINQTTRIRAR